MSATGIAQVCMRLPSLILVDLGLLLTFIVQRYA